MGFLMLIYHLLAKGVLPLTKNYCYLYLLVGIFKYIKKISTYLHFDFAPLGNEVSFQQWAELYRRPGGPTDAGYVVCVAL